ncbi:enzymatic polyprotein endonuclease reverse [Lasius niger]|uniref:Enzymatic polyprotein endonuclease reverse n=1 Tax=Lasius niger TaxID=67767 RepID=A0A0J7K7Q1_LASNI|nr:enzymatic polyprotein endonuclease reverse [Lasius niger]
MFTYNTTLHTATRYTPFKLVYGHQVDLSTAMTKPPKSTYDYNDYAQELKERLRATNQHAKENVKEEKQKAKKHYDKTGKKTKFKIGDKALVVR